jgi:hypothetical protein
MSTNAKMDTVTTGFSARNDTTQADTINADLLALIRS